jgi:hypothetical protein
MTGAMRFQPSSGPVSVAGGNYGAISELTLISNGTTVVFNLAGDITLNNQISIQSYNGKSETVNTQGFSMAASGLNFGNFLFTGSTTVNFGGSSVDLGTNGLYANNNAGSHTLNLDTSSVTTSGQWKMVDGTGTLTVNPGTSTVTFDGAADQAMTLNNQGFYNLTINNGGVAGSDDITIDDDLDVNGKFTLTDGDFNSASYSLSFAQDFIRTGGSWTDIGSTVYFDGITDQTLTPSSVTFNDMIIVNAGAAGDDDLLLAADLDINGDFTLTDGDMNPGASSIFFAGTATIGTSGTFTKGTGTVVFEPGTTVTDNTATKQDWGKVIVR